MKSISNNKNECKCDIFISWSYNRFSQQFAEKLKHFICSFYKIKRKRVFVSSQDLHGEDWVRQIQKFANSCKIGISCITSSTKKNEWLVYELGAMSFNTEVILVAIDFPRYELTADFYSPHTCKSGVQEDKPLDLGRFKSLIADVFEELSNSNAFNSLTKLSKSECKKVFAKRSETKEYNEEVKELFETYNRFSARYSFFISRPMQNYNRSDALKAILDEFFPDKPDEKRDVYYSKNENKLEVKDASNVGGERLENISNSGTFVLIWPKMDSTTPSSCLIELGAALALNKGVLVFMEKGANKPLFFSEFSKKELIEYNNEDELKILLKKHIIEPLKKKEEKESQKKQSK